MTQSTPSHELPKTFGFYWWRLSAHGGWKMIRIGGWSDHLIATNVDAGTALQPDACALKWWAENRPIGEWVPVPEPDVAI